jgi:hypothetical protein
MGTIMQLGGGGKSHNPWDTTLFDAGTDVIYKRYADLHMQLNPLLWTLALEAGKDGTPVTRPARFMDACDCDDATFFVGDNLVAAPVITPGATTRSVVLPHGQWVDRATGMLATGGVALTVPAPLDVLPLWQRANSLVPMFARYADTLLPATAPGVTSYADPQLGRELRIVYTAGLVAQPLEGGGPQLTLHDGARAIADESGIIVTGGTQYTVFTIDIDARAAHLPFSAPATVSADGTDLPTAASAIALEQCAAPGCWHFDPTTKKLQARVFAATGEARSILVR